MFVFSIRQPWVRAIVAGLCIYHMLAMVSANLPFSTAFGSELRRPFSHYIGYVGLWQNWVMFHTIPYFRSIRPVLVAEDADGTKTDYGPMLPGLTPYDHRTRLGSLFFRYTWPANDIQPYANGYFQRACGEIAAKAGHKPSSVTLRLDSRRLLSLNEARATHQTGKPSSDTSTLNVKCQ